MRGVAPAWVGDSVRIETHIFDELRDDREEKIRLETRVEQLEQDLERVRAEQDEAQARYNEAQGKLKVHHSERDGALSRLTMWLS